MLWVIYFMFKDNSGPLMYINSVQTPNNQKFGQQVYDSRNPVKIIKNDLKDSKDDEKKEIITLRKEEITLLEKIIILNQKDLSVYCKFYCNGSDEINDNLITIVAPIKLDDAFVTIINDGLVTERKLSGIKMFLIN